MSGFLRFADFKLPDVGRGSAVQRLGVSGYEGERIVSAETITKDGEPWVRVWWYPADDLGPTEDLQAAFDTVASSGGRLKLAERTGRHPDVECFRDLLRAAQALARAHPDYVPPTTRDFDV